MTSSFPICIPLISFCCLIALAGTLNTILTRYGESGQPFLIPDFNVISLSFSLFSLVLAVGLLYVAFIMFRYYWILSKAFSTSNEMVVFFYFSLLIWWITLIDFHMLNHSCISGIKPPWTWCIIFLIWSWFLFSSNLSIFTSVFMSEIGL